VVGKSPFKRVKNDKKEKKQATNSELSMKIGDAIPNDMRPRLPNKVKEAPRQDDDSNVMLPEET
jgi:hypothetical protein